MKSFQAALVAAAQLVATTLAVDITVASSGGNATSGHQYGFLHEVRRVNRQSLAIEGSL
jgi:alpha-L-arabinofuranosidase